MVQVNNLSSNQTAYNNFFSFTASIAREAMLIGIEQVKLLVWSQVRIVNKIGTLKWLLRFQRHQDVKRRY